MELKMLLVDDDMVDRTAVRRALEASNMDVYLAEAEDCAEAKSMMSDEAFDCVLLDYHLPDQDGASMFDELRRTMDDLSVVIFLTGENNPGLAEELMRRGAAEYITKSELSPTLLRDAISSALARHQYIRDLRLIGEYDPLTGLPGAQLFDRCLSEAVMRGNRSGRLFAVAKIGLNEFTRINNYIGHAIGDKVLSAAGSRLTTLLRQSDYIARLDGDTFAVIGQYLLNEDGSATLADKVLRSLSEPFDIDGHSIFLSASVGVSIYPNDGTDANTLLERADLAMRHSRKDGRGRFSFFDKSLDIDFARQRNLEAEIRDGLNDDSFSLTWEKEFDCSSGDHAASNARPSWTHDDLGTLSGRDLLALSCKSKALTPVGEWYFREVCRSLSDAKDAGETPRRTVIEVHGYQLEACGFAEFIFKTVKKFGLTADDFTLSVCDQEFADFDEKTIASLKELADAGFRIRLSKFGASAQNITAIGKSPVSEVSLDEALTGDMADGSEDMVVVLAIVRMAQTLGLKIVMPGICNEFQHYFAYQNGADAASGAYYSGPNCAPDASNSEDAD